MLARFFTNRLGTSLPFFSALSMPPKRGTKRKTDEANEEEATGKDRSVQLTLTGTAVTQRQTRRSAASKAASEPEPVVVATETAEASSEKRSQRKSVAAAAKAKADEGLAAAAWSQHETCVIRVGGVEASEIIYGFDMDDTLIKTKSGAKFAKSAADWVFWDESVPRKLKELSDSGIKLVIFTNQAGVSKGHADVQSLKTKIDALTNAIGAPIQVFMATADDTFRKPSTDMWDLMVRSYNGSQVPDLSKSYFIGDAAGREKNWAPGRAKDFSCGDRKFAHNISINFATPEEFFLKHKAAPFSWGSIDPKTVKSDLPLFTPSTPPLASTNQELILLVGRPASGKSTFCKRHLIPHGYVHVNRDTLKTKEKCYKVCEEALQQGKKVVVDNTNPDVPTRKEYVDLAKAHKVPVRCFVMTTPQDLADHLNMYRERVTKGESPHVPRVGVNTFKGKFQEPSAAEGFAEIKRINFVPTFDSPADEKLFRQYT